MIGAKVWIKINNLGPVKAAEINLSSLVVFIGPNNSGKSFTATVLYSALSQTGVAGSARLTSHMRRLRAGQISDDLSADVQSFISDAIELGGSDTFRLMSDEIRFFFESRINESLIEYMTSVAEEIVRTTGVGSIGEVRRLVGGRARPGSLTISSSKPSWEIELKIKRDSFSIIANKEPSLREIWQLISHGAWRRLGRRPGTPSILLREFLNELARVCFREVPFHTKYLPAARTGFLHAQKALAGSLVRRASFAGIEDLRIPAMSGVVTDFLGEMIELDPIFRGDFPEEADRLEREVLHGEIGLTGDKETTQNMVYSTASGEYPLSRTSSMVSELAPVVLYLRHRLRKGDLLVVEEPEAHLHPGTQVTLASSLVRLVNNGLRIVLTTHSEFFLQQINNTITASAARAPDDTESSTEARLRPSAVSAYLFSPTSSGTAVIALSVDPEEGISDSSFSEVSERLYHDAVALDRSIERGQER